MNLFNDPPLSELCVLVSFIPDYQNNYDLLVDHDGEVLLEPSVINNQSQLNKYKFYFRGLHGRNHIGILATRNLVYLSQLYKNLLYCWKNEQTGEIDFDEITCMQTLYYWLDKRKISLNPSTEKDIISSGIVRKSFRLR